MRELTGYLSWPDFEAEHANQRRHKNEEPAAGLDGKPLVPQDFGGGEDVERAEAEMADLYRRIFETPVQGLKPEWQRTWDLAIIRDADGNPQVERKTYAPELLSLRDISSWLAVEEIRTKNGTEVLPQQVQEWKLRVGIPKVVRYFFELHPEVLQAYLEKRREDGERDIPPDELLQRFVDGVIRLLKGQKSGRHQEQ